MQSYFRDSALGFGVAYIVGGAVVDAVSDMPDLELPVIGSVAAWQTVFFYVAAPGLLVLLLLLTVREPPRRDLLRTGERQGATLGEFVAFVKTNRRTFLGHSLGFGCLGLLVNGMALWTPTFLFRTYGWEIADAGIAYGVLLLIFGGSGVYLGGWVADYIDRNGRRGGPFIAALAFAIGAVLPACAYPLMPSDTWALALMAPMILCSSAP